MANTNTPYIAKNAAPLTNPVAATVFLQTSSPIATVAATQVAKPAFVAYRAYATFGAGTSNNQGVVNFNLMAKGRVTGGTTTNFTPALQISVANAAIPSTTAASNTTICTATAIPFNSASGSWRIVASLEWDQTSGGITGTFSAYGGVGGVAPTLTAAAAVTPVTGYAVVTPVSTVTGTYSSGEIALMFDVTGLFSASNANNIAYLDEFSVEVS